MKNIILFIIFLVFIISVSAQNKTLKYISKYSDVAVLEMNKYKIPASITLAQAILESGSGESRLAVEGNNHFGIKCHDNWSGEIIIQDDDLPGECFRKYSNVADSYRDHSRFLTERGRYSFLFEYNQDDYKKWARGLKKAGYATNPKYASLLINLIEKYNLSRYDNGITKEQKIFFSHSYGAPYLTGIGIYYLLEKNIYFTEVNTSFVFSEINIGYSYKTLNKFYVGTNFGWIYIPIEEKKLTPQIAGELIYNTNSILVRIGSQVPLLSDFNYKLIPFLKLTYLVN